MTTLQSRIMARLRIIAGAAALRNMLGASERPLEKRKAMTWALMKLEGDQP